jgi:hypothetical protein
VNLNLDTCRCTTTDVPTRLAVLPHLVRGK